MWIYHVLASRRVARTIEYHYIASDRAFYRPVQWGANDIYLFVHAISLINEKKNEGNLKNLMQQITDGSARVSHATIFIENNAQH